MEKQTVEEVATEEVKLSASDIATRAVQSFWAKIKETFNLSPKNEETTPEEAEEVVKRAFVELKADFEGFTIPKHVDNTELIENLNASIEEMKSELIQLKGGKGVSSGDDKAPMSQKAKPDEKTAQQKAYAKAGKFFSNKIKNR